MPPLPKTDVVVIGGGPGGTATAIRCAQHGLHVTLIEGAELSQSLTSETLHPEIEPLLQTLGVRDSVLAAGFPRCPGRWIALQGERQFHHFGEDSHGPKLGFQVKRSHFDTLLLEQAKALGVNILQPCRAIEPLVSQGQIQGLITTWGGIEATYVVDATGRCQWLARKLKLITTPYSPPLHVEYGYVMGHCSEQEYSPLIASAPGGWVCVAKVQPLRYQWTRLKWAEHSNASWHPPNLAHLWPGDPPHTVEVTWRLVNPAAGPGYFLVGDAAAVLDPISSQGVLKAVASGMMAAHLINKQFQGGQLQPSPAARYSTWLRTNFYQDLLHLQRFYSPVLSEIATLANAQ
ncbi:tryptophan 7-halogenase [Acaryochloris sp. IP29b_bin.148]|uniref:NAD(P)/FAD-dependent oxidoreductase n=1 Tax=Acaryochloris sp. IP29b_bin.148 TaxID=2969218 RepID=UPI0026249458|nr:tryptophan 7-halogenase [Acaryochloris sp. IP29b_bin.148]